MFPHPGQSQLYLKTHLWYKHNPGHQHKERGRCDTMHVCPCQKISHKPQCDRELPEDTGTAKTTVSHGDTKTQRRNGAESVACDQPAARAAISTNGVRAQTHSCPEVCVRTPFVLIAGGRLRRPLVARVFSVRLRCSASLCKPVTSGPSDDSKTRISRPAARFARSC